MSGVLYTCQSSQHPENWRHFLDCTARRPRLRGWRRGRSCAEPALPARPWPLPSVLGKVLLAPWDPPAPAPRGLTRTPPPSLSLTPGPCVSAPSPSLKPAGAPSPFPGPHPSPLLFAAAPHPCPDFSQGLPCPHSSGPPLPHRVPFFIVLSAISHLSHSKSRRTWSPT